MSPETRFLGELDALLKQAAAAYRAYLDGGKKFQHALILKGINDSVTALLLQNTHSLPETQSRNAGALLHHLEVWRGLWEKTAEKEKPGLSSVFCFENTVNFPKSEVSNLMEYYETLKA